MATFYTLIEKTCYLCGSPMKRVHMKNMYINDCENECTNIECDNYMKALLSLQAKSRQKAKLELEKS